ncbi:citrate transporter [Fervidobacterium thailandense]|uniref:Citrate transporter n=2 Tax=Fervidobacterium thailandense TaxID=1008305 RepID=A0A1E3G3C1_9BACT|nr:citrate transporter [Fervidobacterium thailandense]
MYVLSYLFIVLRPNIAPVTTMLFGLTSVLLVGWMNLADFSRLVDFNTMFVLIGMMITVSILKERGVFSAIAERIVKLGKGKILTIVTLVYVSIFFLSAFLDNVTTILIFIPILLYICDISGIDYKLVTANAIFFSNLGGMTTAIGDPPNIVIYSASRLSFVAFILYLMPIGFLIAVATLVVTLRDMGRVDLRMEEKEQYSTPSRVLLMLIPFGLVVFGMAFHEVLELELGIVALFGALILMFSERKSFQEIASEIDWDTLFLIAGLYLLDAAIERLGLFLPLITILKPFARSVLLSVGVLWGSIVLTGFLSALPVTMIMLAVVKKLILYGASTKLYWALALGVGIGGNLTPVASMCNIVGNNVILRYKNERISFGEFMKASLKPVLTGGIISSVYLLLLK